MESGRLTPALLRTNSFSPSCHHWEIAWRHGLFPGPVLDYSHCNNRLHCKAFMASFGAGLGASMSRGRTPVLWSRQSSAVTGFPPRGPKVRYAQSSIGSPVHRHSPRQFKWLATASQTCDWRSRHTMLLPCASFLAWLRFRRQLAEGPKDIGISSQQAFLLCQPVSSKYFG